MKQDFLREENLDTIDGSVKEGGGQILRNSISTAALLGRNLKIVNIRAKRSKPGLKPQHLTGILLVKEMHNASLVGAKVNSTEITFSSPKKFDTTLREFTADTKTAGSVALLQQIALPCAVFAPETIRFHFFGGTNAEHAPQMDYITQIFLPTARHMGVDASVEMKKRGFYPQGGGNVELTVNPVRELRPIELLSRGSLVSIRGVAYVSGRIPFHVAERMVKSADECLRKGLKELMGDAAKDVQVTLEPRQETPETAMGDGTGILIVATTSSGCLLGGSSLGERGKRAETVGEEAAKELLRNLQHGGCVDEYLQDQLIIFMAFAKGISKVKTGPLTLHTETSIYFVSQLSGAKFSVKEVPSEERKSGENTFIIECEGIGFQNPHFPSE